MWGQETFYVLKKIKVHYHIWYKYIYIPGNPRKYMLPSKVIALVIMWKKKKKRGKRGTCQLKLLKSNIRWLNPSKMYSSVLYHPIHILRKWRDHGSRGGPSVTQCPLAETWPSGIESPLKNHLHPQPVSEEHIQEVVHHCMLNQQFNGSTWFKGSHCHP